VTSQSPGMYEPTNTGHLMALWGQLLTTKEQEPSKMLPVNGNILKDFSVGPVGLNDHFFIRPCIPVLTLPSSLLGSSSPSLLRSDKVLT
jgi:hypothetical protein